MRKQVLLILALVVLPVTPLAGAKDALEKPNEEKRELLANHETLAVFDGVNYRLCMGRTALAILATPAAKEDMESPMKETTLDIKTKKAEDYVNVKIKNDTATLDVSSQSGIGGATITLSKGKWPTTVVLRLHLGGLESFAVFNGKIKLTGSVLSHSGNTRLLDVVEDGKEKKVEKGSPYWMEIRGFDSTGKPVKGLPDKGGYFEIALPKALLEGQPKSLELGWIDFYRG